MNVIITSEFRVGSRWLHYFLKDLLGKGVSPEIGADVMKKEHNKILQHFSQNRIVKFHHALPENILATIKPKNYKIIGVVRNPRDRLASRTFHRKYSKKGPDSELRHLNDKEAVRYVVMQSAKDKVDTLRQFELMSEGYSTQNKADNHLPYIWTSYEWMLNNLEREAKSICSFLGMNLSDKRILQVVNNHSFESKSGRKPGNEHRKNLWRRKGVMTDWVNWFTEDMVKHTMEEQERYWCVLMRNSRRG